MGRYDITTKEDFWREWGSDPFADYTDDYDKNIKAKFMEDLDRVIRNECSRCKGRIERQTTEQVERIFNKHRSDR